MTNKTAKKYDDVCELIISQAAQAGQKIGDRLPAERKLTELFGVSRSTVQHALHVLTERGMLNTVQGSGSYWTAEPKKVMHTSIPFVTPYQQGEVFFKYISGMESFCKTHNIFLSIHMTDSDIEREKNVINELVKNGYRVIIVYSSVTDYSPDFYISHIQNGVRFIFLDHMPLGVCSDLVCSNNTDGGFRVTEKLIKRGHNNILFLFNADKNSSSNERYYGYKAALSYYKIPFKEELILDFHSLEYDFKKLKSNLEALFAKENPPTACIAVDIGYLDVFNNLTSSFSSRPEAFEIMLYDQYPSNLKNYYSVGVVQPFFDLGFAAAELAFNRISGSKGPYITKIFPNQDE